MNTKKLRNLSFYLHRWLGLVTGILLCIAGITGSILVFRPEIDEAVIAARFGRVIPSETKVSLDAIANTIKNTYASVGFNLSDLNFPSSNDRPYVLSLMNSAEKYWQVFVNPYTGQIMGDRSGDTNWAGIILNLHYQLFAGDAGVIIMGIVALVTVILSLTGIILWPGWRKLAAGFKIKWNARIKRLNFDLHKVAGIITAIFLAAIGFTGFAWNIPQAGIEDGIYALTFTPKPSEPVSQVIPDRPMSLDRLIQRADEAIPNAKNTYISLGSKPEDPITVGKKQTGETGEYGNTVVILDRSSGKVLQLKDGIKPNRAEAILNQFTPWHYGYFLGLATRILYVLVGLAPTILFITGFVMYRLRHRQKPVKEKNKALVES
jgi:uncharacterized iron-regulated membrane protein